jgi:hypothetical protein
VKKRIVSYGIAIIVLGVVALAMGAAFVGQGFVQQSNITNRMRQEDVTLGMLGVKGDMANQVIDNSAAALLAADTVRGHRHAIAPSYEALLGGKQFDPTNPKHLSYAQAINLENYLYLGVTALGLVTVVLATGGFMLVTGVALCVLGVVMVRLI